jgi:hypothetical protein
MMLVATTKGCPTEFGCCEDFDSFPSDWEEHQDPSPEISPTGHRAENALCRDSHVVELW